MLIKDILFLKIVYLDRHNHREINNLILVDILRTRISGGGRNIVHVHPHIFLLELLCLFVSIDEANYPCQKSSTSDGYYYVYYYYRRLTPEYDCDNLPEDFYTGIVTKKEETLGYTSISVALFFNFITNTIS